MSRKPPEQQADRAEERPVWAAPAEGGEIAPSSYGARRGAVPADAHACAPQLERGRRRVDAILAAASAILAEEGSAGLTLEAVARRSRTSKSSMYRFFRSREAVLDALAARHATNAARERARGDPDADTDWGALTAEEAVDRYLRPLRDYIARNPDVVAVMRAVGRRQRDSECAAGLDAFEIARAERLIAARSPDATPSARRARAATMFAVVVGVLELSTRPVAPPHDVLMRELSCVLVAYLRAHETPTPAADCAPAASPAA